MRTIYAKRRAKILINRDVRTVEQARVYLQGDLQGLHAPYLLKDCKKAAGIIREKVQAGKYIRIIGDYDCDGICATFILWSILKELGASVDY